MSSFEPFEARGRISDGITPRFILEDAVLARLQQAIATGDQGTIGLSLREELTTDWTNKCFAELEQLAPGHRHSPVAIPTFVARGIVEQLPASQDLQSQLIEHVSYEGAIYFRHQLPRSFMQLNALTDEVARHMAATASPEEAMSSWRFPMLVGSELLSAHMFRTVLDGYDIKHRDRKSLELLSLENDGLFEHTRFLQRYQMKPALVKAAGAGSIGDWMVVDWEQTQHSLVQQGVVSDISALDHTLGALARFYGTKHQFVADKPVFERHGNSSYGMIRLNFADAIKGKGEWTDTPDVAFQLSNEGHLLGMRGIPLKEYSERLGKRDEYELLRGEALAIYADLVLPAHLVREAAALEDKDIPARHGKPRAVDTIRRLVLARMRLVKGDPAGVEQEVKRENRKSPGQHGVVGFIRNLPKGCRASFEAREACRKYLHKELAAEGETFVVPHIRGGAENGQPPVTDGHRAIRRHVGAAVLGRHSSLE